MRVDLRPLEAALEPKKLLNPREPTGLVPIALINRLDRVPNDWSNCGEHRIIYSFKKPIIEQDGILTGRFFLIFEAVTENPRGVGFEGCRATARFWRDLSDNNRVSQREKSLEDFFYKGIPGTAGPVVVAKNYGGALGQVRGNYRLTTSGMEFKWQLREWVIVNAGYRTNASFLSVPVDDNPLAQFYLDKNGVGSDKPLDPVLEASEREKFHEKFLDTYLTNLLEPDTRLAALKPGQANYDPELDLKSKKFKLQKYEINILNGIGARIGSRFNEFQAVSEDSEDDPAARAGMILRERINSELMKFGIQMDPQAVLNRAGAITCGGCHHFTTFQKVGEVAGYPINWPSSALGDFVQITEDGKLSKALTDVFVPFRKDRLAEAVCIPVNHVRKREIPSASIGTRINAWEELLATARLIDSEASKREVIQRAI